MSLSEIEKQLDSVQNKLKKVKTLNKTIADESAGVVSKYSQLSKNISGLNQGLQGLVPKFLHERLETLNEKNLEGLKLAEKQRDLGISKQKMLEDQIKIYSSIKDKEEEILILRAKYQAAKRKEDSVTKQYISTPDKTSTRAFVLRKQLEAAGEEQNKIKDKIDDAQKSQAKLASEGEKITANLKATNKEYKQVDLQLNKITASSSHKLATSLIEIKKLITKHWKEMAEVVFFVEMAVKSFHSINALLTDSNASLTTRIKLYKSNLAVSFALGVSTETTAQAQQALLQYGLKTHATNTDTLKTAVMLNQTFGISVDEAARLDLLATRLGSNFTKVGDAITVMTQQFNLSAQESAKLAESIANINIGLGNQTKNLPQLAVTLGAYSGKLKALGAQSGDIESLLKSFTTNQGLNNAILFGGSKGVLNQKDFSNPEKIADILQNVASRFDQFPP